MYYAMDSPAIRFRLSLRARRFISKVQADTNTHTATHQIDAINISAGLSVPGAQLFVSKTKPIEIMVPVLHFQPKKKSEPFSESSLCENIKICSKSKEVLQPTSISHRRLFELPWVCLSPTP